MLKELIEKRSQIMKDWGVIREKTKLEKREFSGDEMTKINDYKISLDDLNKQIETEQLFEAETQRKLQGLKSVTVPDMNVTGQFNQENLVSRANGEFTKFVRGQQFSDEFRSQKGGFKFPHEYFEQRTTVVSSDAKLQATQTLPVNIIEKGLQLSKLGAPAVQYVSAGSGFKAPYLSSSPATYNAEDSSNADQTWSAGSFDLVPKHSSASYEISGQYFKQVSPASIDAIIASLQNRIFQGLEKKAIDSIITNAATKLTGTTATTDTFYAKVLTMEKNTEYLTGYLFTKTSAERAKKSKVDTASGFLVYQNNQVNGVPAVASSLFTGNTMISGDFSHLAQVIWDGVEVNLMQDVAAKRKGNYILIADAFSDATVTNPAAFVTCISTDKLALSN